MSENIPNEHSQINSPNASGSPGRILVVDDNALNLKITRLILTQAGEQVDTAADGFEALEMVARHYYPLILMDIQMPKMDGIETTRRIRSQHFAQGQPAIVAISAFATESNRQRCLDEGMDGFLGKPVPASTLQDVVKRYLESKSASSVVRDADSNRA
ncbi:MAG: response regulator [Opitutales bacterium]